jgi:hypothetical protein
MCAPNEHEDKESKEIESWKDNSEDVVKACQFARLCVISFVNEEIPSVVLIR